MRTLALALVSAVLAMAAAADACVPLRLESVPANYEAGSLINSYARQAAVILIMRAERGNQAHRKFERPERRSGERRAYDFELVPVRALAEAAGARYRPFHILAYDAHEIRAEEEATRFPRDERTYLEIANDNSAHLSNDYPLEAAFDDEYCMTNKVVLEDEAFYLVLLDDSGHLYRMAGDADWLGIPVQVSTSTETWTRVARPLVRLRGPDDPHVAKTEAALLNARVMRQRLDLPWYERLWRQLFGFGGAPRNAATMIQFWPERAASPIVRAGRLTTTPPAIGD